jgi:transposase-like protein
MFRRQFTKEFKEAAVRWLELGASLAEVARACTLAQVSRAGFYGWRQAGSPSADGGGRRHRSAR